MFVDEGIEWIGGRAPPDEPACGFDGHLCRRRVGTSTQVRTTKSSSLDLSLFAVFMLAEAAASGAGAVACLVSAPAVCRCAGSHRLAARTRAARRARERVPHASARLVLVLVLCCTTLVAWPLSFSPPSFAPRPADAFIYEYVWRAGIAFTSGRLSRCCGSWTRASCCHSILVQVLTAREPPLAIPRAMLVSRTRTRSA